MIALPNMILQGHLLKKHIVIAVQAMLLARYTKRQESQEIALETALERQLEGEPTEGSAPASQNANILAALHVPAQRELPAAAAERIKSLHIHGRA